MAKVVVGLFDQVRAAQSAHGELQSAGFGGDSSILIDNNTQNLDRYLAGAGIPDDDTLLYADGLRRGGAIVMAHGEADEAERAAEIIDRFHPVDIDRRRAEFSRSTESYTSQSQTTSAASSTGAATHSGGNQEIAIPVVEEEVHVGKRTVERGGIRVFTRVEELPVSQQVQLRDERIEVARVPVDRPVDPATVHNIDEAFIEDSFVVTERDEQAVVEKQARVSEEVVIRKDVAERTEQIQATERHTRVDVEEIEGQSQRQRRRA